MLSINDAEGAYIPTALPPVIDSHVHIFPANFFSAIHKWFDDHAWPIRYQMESSRLLDFLLSHGIRHIVALQYAHKPGLAWKLNEYMAVKCKEFGHRLTGLATVYPGEKNAEQILQQGFDSGLGGVKLHNHVQCFEIDGEDMYLVYECCRRNNKPIVMHVGREPKSAAYRCDPYQLCKAEKVERVLNDFPDLKICVPHLGIDEIADYHMLIEKYDNLWLDTAMVVTDYFQMKDKIDVNHYRPDRIMYGSDFPNIPYAWDRELKELSESGLSKDALAKICCTNSLEFFKIDQDQL